MINIICRFISDKDFKTVPATLFEETSKNNEDLAEYYQSMNQNFDDLVIRSKRHQFVLEWKVYLSSG